MKGQIRQLRRRRNLGTLALLGSALVALMLLASGLSRVELRPGQPYLLIGLLQLLRSLRSETPLSPGGPAGSVRLPLTFLVWILVPLAAGFLIVAPDVRRALIKRFAAGMVVVTVVYLVLRALTEAYPQTAGGTSGTGSNRGPSPDTLPPLPVFVASPPGWLVATISLLLGVLILGALWLLWRITRRRPDPLALLAEEAGEALGELQSGADLKDVVLRCYVEMSAVLGRQRGVARPKGMTPREFEQQLAQIGLRDEHIRRLTRLFEGVRYGAHAPGEREQHEAVACLTAIVQAYGPPA